MVRTYSTASSRTVNDGRSPSSSNRLSSVAYSRYDSSSPSGRCPEAASHSFTLSLEEWLLIRISMNRLRLLLRLGLDASDASQRRLRTA